MKAWLGLGSNLDQPEDQLREALRRLEEADQVEILRVSSFYRTPPWGDAEQNDFINAVAEIETDLRPLPLLEVLQSIESVMGRVRSGRRWGPRKIDLDLLLYAEERFQSPELEIPHPRMSERAFVLVPLCELEAGLEIPGLGEAKRLLRDLDCEDIRRLEDEA